MKMLGQLSLAYSGGGFILHYCFLLTLESSLAGEPFRKCRHFLGFELGKYHLFSVSCSMLFVHITLIMYHHLKYRLYFHVI